MRCLDDVRFRRGLPLDKPTDGLLRERQCGDIPLANVTRLAYRDAASALCHLFFAQPLELATAATQRDAYACSLPQTPLLLPRLPNTCLLIVCRLTLRQPTTTFSHYLPKRL